MCERALNAGAALALALALATGAAAQDPSAEMARLSAQADSLERLHERAEEAADALRPRVDSGASVPIDTQLVGSVRVISERADTAMARAVTERALRMFGEIPAAAPDALDSTWLLIEVGNSVDGFGEMGRRPGHEDIWLPRWRSPSWHARLAANEIGAALAAALPQDVRAWAGTRLRADRSEALREAYRVLAYSASPAASDCRHGDVARCIDALGLSAPGADWQRWYSEDQLVAWALAQGQELRAGVDLRERCDAARTLAACRDLIERRGGPPAPLGLDVRATLVAHVLHVGGADAWRALNADTVGVIADRLARAAHTDVRSLVADWRADVIAARPVHRAGLASTGLATLFWIAVLAAIAARSTRWRLG